MTPSIRQNRHTGTSHALRPISSFQCGTQATGVLCPDVPGGRSGMLFAHAGHHVRPLRLRHVFAQPGVRPGMLSGAP